MTQPRRPMRQPKTRTRTAAGCGCAGVIAAAAVIVLITALVAWLLALTNPSDSPSRQPTPTTMPPAAAEAPPMIDIHGPGRTSDQLFEWSQSIGNATNVNGQAIRAYANAALIAQEAWPTCNLQWNTLAGIGWVETRHGTYSGRFEGSRLDENGYPKPPIIGPALDGTQGFAKVQDTDQGHHDNDTEFDRAVGPMQFIPESWAIYGRDANGDGVADPQQIDDAALSAANLLCNGGAQPRDLSTEDGWRDAIFGYNHSSDYVAKVRDAAANYALGQPAHR